MLELEDKYGYNFRFSEPIVYKETITLYPVIFDNLDDFKFAALSLLYNPLDYPDIEIASLPRLYFLTEILNHQNDTDFIMQNCELYNLFLSLQKILDMVTQKQPLDFVQIDGFWRLRFYNDDAKTAFIDINATDFNELREIILQQNGCDYVDEFVHADIQKYIEENETIKDSNFTSTDEDIMEAIMIDLKILDEQLLKKLSMRRYNHLYTKIMGRETYNIFKTASMNGMVTFKEEIPHWLQRQKLTAAYRRLFKTRQT